MRTNADASKWTAGKTAPERGDWNWQMSSRIRLDEGASFPTVLTPYYAALIEKWEPTDPVFRIAVRQEAEETAGEGGFRDPLQEERSSPVSGLIRRYADRAVVLATSVCASHCRYCDRKRFTGKGKTLADSDLQRIVNYLNANRQIRDVIISGGDPLTLDDGHLEKIISSIHGTGGVEMLRIGTRVPVTLPMRVTTDLCAMLRKYHPLYINTHFNHPMEFTADAARACAMLADAGIQLGNQSVLLKGVNDSLDVLEELCRGLLRMRVKPYYIFQCEPVPGTAHLRMPIKQGMALMDELRSRVGGMALPAYVLDTEDKGGKIPLTPDRVLSTEDDVLLKTNDGRVISV